MPITVMVIHPDVHPEVRGIQPTLEEFQRLVGGYIEHVRVSADVHAYVNDNPRGLEVNAKASALAGQLIYGPMVLFRIAASDEQSLTDQDIDKLIVAGAR